MTNKQPYTSHADASWLQRRWIRVLLCLLAIAVAVGIFLFSAQTGSESSRLSNWIADFIIRMVDIDYAALLPAELRGIDGFVHKLVRKGAHFTEFALLGFLLRLLAGSFGLRRPTRICWVAGTLYACTDELHQLFVANRACMWQDVLLDSCGVLAGITLAYALLVVCRRLKLRLRH